MYIKVKANSVLFTAKEMNIIIKNCIKETDKKTLKNYLTYAKYGNSIKNLIDQKEIETLDNKKVAKKK